MWRTPAPPSTARVAASIWSGTGEVKTLPAHAASSIPSPTNPPWSGSWPDPPPEIRPTLPACGPPARRTTAFATSILTMSGWAAARPARLSGTMSSIPLISFFIVWVGAVAAMTGSFAVAGVTGLRGRSGVGVGLLRGGDPGNGGGRVMTDELVQEGADETAADRAGDVDPELIEVGRRADDAAEDLRTDLAGRVQRGAGDRADEDDDPVDDEPDDDTGEAGGRPSVDSGTEDGEHEDRGADDFGEEADEVAGIGVDGDRAEAERLRVVAAQDDERQPGADERA